VRGRPEPKRDAEHSIAGVDHSVLSRSKIAIVIGFSPDNLLHSSQAGPHRRDLGTHSEMGPVNRPKSPVNTHQRDGPMRFDAPKCTDTGCERTRVGAFAGAALAALIFQRVNSGDHQRY
jgi:catalase